MMSSQVSDSSLTKDDGIEEATEQADQEQMHISRDEVTEPSVEQSIAKPSSTVGFGGFSTAKGTAVKVSGSALKKAQDLFGEDFQEMNNEGIPASAMDKVPDLGGFSTAKGTAVKVR